MVSVTGTAVSAMWGAAAVLAAGVTNTFGAAALELLPIILGIGGRPTRPAASQFPNASNRRGIMAVIFSVKSVSTLSATCLSTIYGICATLSLSS
jgi:hypothetical protein